MKIIVDAGNYALFDYPMFLDRNNNTIERPSNISFEIGQVVYDKTDNSLGVVLGCIDEESAELRTDQNGMRCYSEIEPATKEHFNIEGVIVNPQLREEVFQNSNEIQN